VAPSRPLTRAKAVELCDSYPADTLSLLEKPRYIGWLWCSACGMGVAARTDAVKDHIGQSRQGMHDLDKV
jgi:hypothetical protein